MIVWLASFPRSGNTLTRALFKRCFDIDTYEHYNNRSRLWSNDRVAEQVGHVYYQGDWKRFHRHAWSADETFFIKTHGAPIDNQKFVYIVRDGRAATYSYFEFLRDFTGQPLSLAEAIAGHGPFGSWSEHVQMWHGRENGPPSLLVRFEDILSSPDQVVEEISDFIGVPVRQRFENKFSEMQSEMPLFSGGGTIPMPRPAMTNCTGACSISFTVSRCVLWDMPKVGPNWRTCATAFSISSSVSRKPQGGG